MATPKLYAQYLLLREHFPHKKNYVNLVQIATICDCSARNTRNILNKMQELNWLQWCPEAGRGRVSILEFTAKIASVTEQYILSLIYQYKYNKALQACQQNLEIFFSYFKKTLGLNLGPTSNNWRIACADSTSCNNFIDSITYNRLAELTSCIKKITAKTWRFYLKHNLHLHSGAKITQELVKDALLELAVDKISIIESVSCCANNSIEIKTKCEHAHFLELLNSSNGLLKFTNKKIGSTDFKIKGSNKNAIFIECLDNKLDFSTIEMLHLPVPIAKFSHVYLTDLSSNNLPLYLAPKILNVNYSLNHDKLNSNQQAAIHYILDTYKLLSIFKNTSISEHFITQAFGLAPDFYHQLPPAKPSNSDLLPHKIQLLLKARKNNFNDELMQCIAKLFAIYNIKLSFEYQTNNSNKDQYDLYLACENIDTTNACNFYNWLADKMDISEFNLHLKGQILNWQMDKNNPLTIDFISRQLVQQQIVNPLFFMLE